ncbi:phage tail protein I [Aurantimonas sp. VKM B-3413]|uniref:phage tail protein I n=1 Tax=Aurantimonas sp. VKM B-3413 TaxID=2779401 RepID=UPI001E315819|nr:phage tail protein I [Aurantimonas sp. VKM B-3413]MCB8835936.1 phage tail protein I [Aurantimonas sp. VKM B-3413]
MRLDDAVSLLNARPPVTFEAVLAALAQSSLDEVRPLAERLRTLWDPWTCAEAELPILAWAWSVDIWDEAWSTNRKRQVIAESIPFHRAKGTIVADRMACGYVDAELISYHLPRDGFAVSPGVSPERYRQWIASLPEIRIYPLPPRLSVLRQSEPEMIPVFPPLAVVGRSPLFRSGQVKRARRAELRQGDRVTDLVVSGETASPDGIVLSEIERVSVPQAVKATLAVGRGPVSAPLGRRPSSRRVFSFDWLPASGDPFDLKPGVPSLIPVETTPRKEPIPQPYHGHRLIVGRTPLRSAIAPSPARDAYYLALHVADGSGPSGARPRQGAIGRDRMPRAKYTKELSVLLARPRRRGWPFSGSRLVPDPAEKAEKVLSALASAQAGRDRVFVNFNVVRDLTVADLRFVDADTRVGETRLTARR